MQTWKRISVCKDADTGLGEQWGAERPQPSARLWWLSKREATSKKPKLQEEKSDDETEEKVEEEEEEAKPKPKAEAGEGASPTPNRKAKAKAQAGEDTSPTPNPKAKAKVGAHIQGRPEAGVGRAADNRHTQGSIQDTEVFDAAVQRGVGTGGR